MLVAQVLLDPSTREEGGFLARLQERQAAAGPLDQAPQPTPFWHN